jgi:peroxiredoxin
MLRDIRFAVVLWALTVLLVAALAGCGGGQEAAESEAEMSEGAVAQQDASVESGGEGVGTEKGMSPPAFTLPALDGAQVSLSDYEGKVVVLDLWATWCPPCRQEIPFLVELHKELESQGLVVLGVGLDQGGESALAPFAEEYGVTYPVLVGNRDVQAAYGVTGIPTTFLIGRDGRIATKHVGYHPSMAESMREEVMALLAVDVEA